MAITVGWLFWSGLQPDGGDAWALAVGLETDERSDATTHTVDEAAFDVSMGTLRSDLRVGDDDDAPAQTGFFGGPDAVLTTAAPVAHPDEDDAGKPVHVALPTWVMLAGAALIVLAWARLRRRAG